jgi:Predicted membrane protein (DUF2207) N-terminal domain
MKRPCVRPSRSLGTKKTTAVTGCDEPVCRWQAGDSKREGVNELLPKELRSYHAPDRESLAMRRTPSHPAPGVFSQHPAYVLIVLLLASLMTACNNTILSQGTASGTVTLPTGSPTSTGTIIPFAAVPSSTASSKSVVVSRRDADLTISDKNEVHFVETWEVRFVGGAFHNAFRWISLAGIGDITNWAVSEAGQAYLEIDSGAPHTFWVSEENGDKKITWYFPETTDQTRTFILRYTLNGAIRFNPNTREFFWKFIESNRAYTISSAHVLVHLPSAFQTNQLATATYEDGVETLDAHVVNGETVGFDGGPFAPGVEWEIRLQFPR